VKLEVVPLASVRRQIETGAGVRISTDWNALKSQGVKPTSEITLQASDVPYTHYFETIAQQLRAGIGIYLQADGTIGLTASNAVPARGTVAHESSAFRSLVPPRTQTVSAPRAHGVPREKLKTDPYDTPADAAARERLETIVKEFAFQRAPLGQVLESLQGLCGDSFTINWKALEAAGISRETTVSVKLSNVPARRVLATILMNADAAANLGYTLDDGIVAISTRDDLNSARYQVVRVFDIGDLLQPRTPIPSNYSHDDMVKELVDTIKTTVAPESWRDAGGQIGSLRELDGKLIINQTQDNQRAVATLLDLLRDKPLTKIENRK
jgi:hypothetical protein